MTGPARAGMAREISLPRRRPGHTTVVTIGGEQFFVTTNAAADGTLGEVFIQWGKHGSGAAGLMDLYASALSMALRHQVPLADVVRSGLNLRFAPAGRTDDPDIPRARSVADYVARRLAIDWLSRAERASLGVHTLAERLDGARTWPGPARPEPAAHPEHPERPERAERSEPAARPEHPERPKHPERLERALVKEGADVVRA